MFTDTWKPMKRYSLENVILAIDLKTRYLFAFIPKSLKFKDMKPVMTKLIKAVRALQKKIYGQTFQANVSVCSGEVNK